LAICTESGERDLKLHFVGERGFFHSLKPDASLSLDNNAIITDDGKLWISL